MAKYTLTSGPEVIRDDGVTIPADPGNVDWQEYQAWLAAGNTPDPAASPEPPMLTYAQFRRLFTPAEFAAIMATSDGLDWLLQIAALGSVSLSDVLVTEGLPVVSGGVLTTARQAQILANEPQR